MRAANKRIKYVRKKYASKKNNELKEIQQAYENLANAIIIQAVDNYREALETEDKHDILALENFFLSNWYSILTNVPGELIIEKIRKECCNGGRKKI